MNVTPARRTIRNLMPMLLLLVFCLLFLYSNPCFWLFGDPLFVERCGIDVDNQTGQTLRVTPISSNGNSHSAVRLYRTTFPIFPAYRQRDILVQSGERVFFSLDCTPGVSGLFVCDLEGECYVRKSIYQFPRDGGVTIHYEEYSFDSLQSLSRPDSALEAAVQSFPEHNYRGPTNVLLAFVQIIALVGGVYGLICTRPSEIRRLDL